MALVAHPKLWALNHRAAVRGEREDIVTDFFGLFDGQIRSCRCSNRQQLKHVANLLAEGVQVADASDSRS